MDIRPLSPDYAVSPQIASGDLPALKAAGYTTVICNRPDGEVGPEAQADTIRAAAEAEGLTFVVNPVTPGQLTEDNVTLQAEAMAAAGGPVLAYCASGNRSSILWALAQAGNQSADDLIAAAARHGYQLDGLRPMIEARARA